MKQLSRSTSTSGMENVLQEGHCVRNRWQVVKKIGQGAFGEVYHCIDKKNDTQVAIKIVSKEKDSNAANQLLKFEVSVLRSLQGQSYFPKFLAFGKTIRFDYLAMELMGPSLSELRRQQPGRKFSLSTTLRLGEMMLKCIQALHRTGYVHRDIKPSNFVMGLGKNIRKVYLLDFGLSRQYLLENRELRPARPVSSFQGTPRYASLTVLNHKEAGRQDDLISLFYVLSEFTFQDLPWKNLRELHEVAEAKEFFDHQILVREFPDGFQDYFQHINDLTYADEPNYELLYSVFDRCMKRRGVRETDPLDFETDDVIPLVNMQKKESCLSAQSQKSQSDVLIVNCTSIEKPLNMEEKLDNIKHQTTSLQKLGESYLTEDSYKKKSNNKDVNSNVNSKNINNSFKDTEFCTIQCANDQLPTFTYENTDIESPVLNFPKTILPNQFFQENNKVCTLQQNDNFSKDSILQNNANFEQKNQTANCQLQNNSFCENVLKAQSQVKIPINFSMPFKNLNFKKRISLELNKPVKEKRRHAVRRSVSQPSRIPSHLIVKNVFNDFSKFQGQQGLPRCWSCPTISLFIRSDLKPPLKQQASFEENVYEVDVMRNVAAAKKLYEEVINCRRNSLPSILNSKTTNVTSTVDEQNLANKCLNSTSDIPLQRRYSEKTNKVGCDVYNSILFTNKVPYLSTSDRKTNVKKSLSDSNVSGPRKSTVNLQVNNQKNSSKIYKQYFSEKNAVNSINHQSIDKDKKNYSISNVPELNEHALSFSLCKSPTCMNIKENDQMYDGVNKIGLDPENYVNKNSNKISVDETDQIFPNEMKNSHCKNMNELCHISKDNVLFSEKTSSIAYSKTDTSFQKNECISPQISASFQDNNIASRDKTSIVNDDLHLSIEKLAQLNFPVTVTNTSGCDNSNSESGHKNLLHCSEIMTSHKNLPSEEIILGNEIVDYSQNMFIPLEVLEKIKHKNPFYKKNILYPKTVTFKNTFFFKEIIFWEEMIVYFQNNKCIPLQIHKKIKRINSIHKKNLLYFKKIMISKKKLSSEEIFSWDEIADYFQNNKFIPQQTPKSYKKFINPFRFHKNLQTTINPLNLSVKNHIQINVSDTVIKRSLNEGSLSCSRSINKLSKSISSNIMQSTENIPHEEEAILLNSITCNEMGNSFQSIKCVSPTNADFHKKLSIADNEDFLLNVNDSLLLSKKGDTELHAPVINITVYESSNDILEEVYKDVPENTINSNENVTLQKITLQDSNFNETLSLQSSECISPQISEFFNKYTMTDNSSEIASPTSFDETSKKTDLLMIMKSNENVNESMKELSENMSKNIQSEENLTPSKSPSLNCDNSCNLLMKDCIGLNVAATVTNDIVYENDNKSIEIPDKKTTDNVIPKKLIPSENTILTNSLNCNETHSFQNNDYNSPQTHEPYAKCLSSTYSKNDLIPNINDSFQLLANNNMQSNTPIAVINEKECEFKISEPINRLSTNLSENVVHSNMTSQCRRRQRENSDDKYVKDEKELNLNFTRRRQRPTSQVFEDSSVLQSDISNELFHPPPDEPPFNHCLPSRRVRYRRALTSMMKES